MLGVQSLCNIYYNVWPFFVLNCFTSRRGAQEQNQAGADDSPVYEDICNVPAEYEIPLDNRSQPRINGRGNTACGISQGSLTTANRRMQS